MNATAIQWTDYSWNPVTGCDKVSPGCRNCYAEALSKRWGRSFEVALHPERLNQVDKLEAGSRVFVNSMSDLFHEKVPFEFTHDVFLNMAMRYDVKFQVLTKRPGRILEFMKWERDNAEEPSEISEIFPANVWFGVSVESRLYLPRIDVLRKIPTHVRFISFEPLLEDVGWFDIEGIQWVIVGGESGKNRRPFDKRWARHILARCRMADVPFFFKQGSGIRPGMDRTLDGMEWSEFPDEVRA